MADDDPFFASRLSLLFTRRNDDLSLRWQCIAANTRICVNWSNKSKTMGTEKRREKQEQWSDSAKNEEYVEEKWASIVGGIKRQMRDKHRAEKGDNEVAYIRRCN